MDQFVATTSTTIVSELQQKMLTKMRFKKGQIADTMGSLEDC